MYDQIHQTAIYLTTVVGHERRYKILCANAVPEPCEPKKATQIILETINLESDQYRMGHTKVSDTCCDPRCDNIVSWRANAIANLPATRTSQRRFQDVSNINLRISCRASFRRSYNVLISYIVDNLFANIKILIEKIKYLYFLNWEIWQIAILK